MDYDGPPLDDAYMLVVGMEAGKLSQATDMARLANEAVACNPEITLMFHIAGCDDDPRELDQIPEAQASFRALYNALEQDTFWRFIFDHQAMMLVAIGAGRRVGTQLQVLPWMVKNPKEGAN